MENKIKMKKTQFLFRVKPLAIVIVIEEYNNEHGK